MGFSTSFCIKKTQGMDKIMTSQTGPEKTRSVSSSSGHEPTDLCQPIFLERYPPVICYIAIENGP